MTVIVHSKTLKVTQAIRSAVLHHAQRLLKRFPRVSQINVFLEKAARKKNDSYASQAEFLVKSPGKDVVVKKTAVDLYKAIHDSAHTAILSLQKLQDRRSSHTSHI